MASHYRIFSLQLIFPVVFLLFCMAELFSSTESLSYCKLSLVMKASLHSLTFERESALKRSCRELVVLVENDLSIGGSDAANFFVCGPLGAPTFRLPVLVGVEHLPALSIPQSDVVLLKILSQNLPGHQDFGRGTPSDECRSEAVFQPKTIAALLKEINCSKYVRI